MNRNKILNAIVLIGNLFCVWLLLSAVALSIILIHWHINPSFYADIPIEALNYQTFMKFTRISTSFPVGQDNVMHLPTVDKIGYLVMYFTYLQFIAIILLILVSVREFMDVINSVKKIQTFVSRNIHSFKKISLCFFVVSLISCFQVISFAHGMFYGLYLHILPLFVALISFTLSEVFKEGHALLEENKATI